MKGSLGQMLHAAFLAPLKCWSLCVMYLSAFVAITGITSVYLYYIFDFASLGMWPVMEHFIVRALLVSMLIMPLWLWLSTVLPFKLYMALVLMTQVFMVGGLMHIGLDGAAWLQTLLFSTSVSSFWTIFHLLMSFSVSDHNSANEVCMADAGVTAGTLVGSILGGVLLTYGLGDAAVLSGAALLFTGTVMLFVLMHKKISRGQLNLVFLSAEETFSWAEIKTQRKNILGTAYEGAFQIVADFLAPVWLKLMSVSAMGVGLLGAAKIGLKFLVTPFVGYLANEASKSESTHNRDLEVGLALKTVGWLPWLFMHTPLLYTFSSLFWTAGQHFFSMGLASRWYKQRSIFKLAVREFALGLGRLVATCIAVPLLYWSLQSYIVFSIVLSTAMLLTTQYGQSLFTIRLPNAVKLLLRPST